MVQQPFVGQLMAASQQQQQPAATSLAMPAIVGTNQQQHQAQYSPSGSFYQQQLIKGAQQFAGVKQQQQQASRLNGLTAAPGRQQDSPVGSSQQMNQQQQEGLYNGLHQSNGAVRPTPIYALRPSYYSNQSATLTSPTPQVYQQAPRVNVQQQPTAAYYQQQQNSPSINQRQQQQQQQQQQQLQQPLSIRQLSTTNGFSAPSSLSPMQNAVDQQQRHLQHLVLSYQQQHQQAFMQQHQASVVESAVQQQHHHHLIQPTASYNEARWSSNNPHASGPQLQHPQMTINQQQSNAQAAVQPSGVPILRPTLSQQQFQPHLSSARFSDRDSLSTLSRFNQFDDRRSFTMRSQYTNANASGPGRQFGFLKLTGEAMKRILGLNSSTGQSQPLLGGEGDSAQMRRNISLASVGGSHKSQAELTTVDGVGQQQQKACASSVTVIDSGEDYYFKRRVFSYQLIILRAINLLFSCFVLLSPVVMLLVPKMEPLLKAAAEQQLQSDHLVQPAGPPLNPVHVTHAVGLGNKNAQQLLKQQHLQQHHQLAIQQQWRISECQSSDCDGPLIGFVVRLILLTIAHWAIFFRSQTASLPRIDFQRCFLISLASLISLAYWLFFVFRVFDKRYNDFELHYMTIINFAISMLETLILLHYLALVLLELRPRKKVYCLKVVRSPDGQSQYFSCGSLSIQKCAQFVLEKYHRNFKQFNSYSEQLLEFEDELAQQLASKRDQQHSMAAPSSRHQSRASSPVPTGSHHHRSRSATGKRRQVPQPSTRPSSARHPDEQPAGAPRSSSGRTATKSGDKPDTELQTSNAEARLAARSETRRSAKRQRLDDNDSSGAEDEHDEIEQADSEPEVADKLGQQNNEANSAEHSSSNSEAPSRVKESSLETVRAANEQVANGTGNQSNRFDLKIQEQETSLESGRRRRDLETESVRSGRSRRSTASHRRHRSRTEKHRDRDKETHHRHHSSSRDHSHRRERPSSRNRGAADEASADPAEQSSGGLVGLATNEALSATDRSSGLDPLGEHERKLRRRKLRLLATVESAFEQIEQIDINEAFAKDKSGSAMVPINGRQPAKLSLDAHQAARSIYPNIARSLQKYLRLTKQTGRHNLQSIYEHLSKCLLYKLNARAFLEKFTNLDPVWQQSETNLFANCRLMNSKQFSSCKRAQELDINSWSLVCDTLLSRQIESGTFFLLKQGPVALLVTVAKLPHLNLNEQVIDESLCRFTINSSPEATPV